MTPTSRHIIRVFISPGSVKLCVECSHSEDAECQVNAGYDHTIGCRYDLWWSETGAALEEFYAGESEMILNDGAEISIDWDGEAWVWDLED